MESLNFIDDFKKMMAELEQAKSGVSILEGEKQQLIQEIEKLTKDKIIILAGIEQEKQKALAGIEVERKNTNRVFKQENDRLDKLSKEIDIKEQR